MKSDYGTYLRADPDSRAWMHASGALATKLAPFLALAWWPASGAPWWAAAVLAALGVLQIVTDVALSTKSSDWKKFRREKAIARQRRAALQPDASPAEQARVTGGSQIPSSGPSALPAEPVEPRQLSPVRRTALSADRVCAVDLVCVGDVMLDIRVDADTLRRGGDVHGRVLLQPGGTSANAAVWGAWAGAATRVHGRVGDDLQGRTVRAALTERGVDAALTSTRGRPPARCSSCTNRGSARWSPIAAPTRGSRRRTCPPRSRRARCWCRATCSCSSRGTRPGSPPCNVPTRRSWRSRPLRGRS